MTVEASVQILRFWNNWCDSEKKPLLDPMATVITLSLLAFKDVGTKIGIRENSLELHPPTYWQGGARWWSGDKHDDLTILGDLLRKVVVQYNGAGHTKTIYRCAKLGLRKLQETYPNSNTSAAAETWYSILDKKGEAPQIEITPLAEKVKEIWDDYMLTQFSKWLEDAFKKQKEGTPDAKKSLQFAIEKIENLLQVKNTEFREILETQFKQV